MAEGVEFEEDKFGMGLPRPGSGGPSSGFQTAGQSSYYSSNKNPPMVQWIIDHHWAKTANGANAILLAVVIINIIITFVVIKYML